MRTFLSLVALFCVASGSFAAQPLRSEPVSRRWTIVSRTYFQDQGDWQVQYALRHQSLQDVPLYPHDIAIGMRGWVSNSRVDGHGSPKMAAAEVNASTGCNVLYDIIPSLNDCLRCRERMTVRMWVGNALDPPNAIAPHIPSISITWWTKSEPFSMVMIPAKELLHIRIRFGHEHFLFGPYNPLLGKRDLSIRLGSDVITDTLPLNQQQYAAFPHEEWGVIPEDRLDTMHFVSKPDSLHLEAHVPGNLSYRFAEKPVRYSTKMRLSFWYLVAPDTRGDFKFQLVQYKDSPHGWEVLHAGMIEKTYYTIDRTCKPVDQRKNVAGRWMHVEHILRTESQATSAALTFRISNSPDNIGEVWIDDVVFEPIGAPSRSP